MTYLLLLILLNIIAIIMVRWGIEDIIPRFWCTFTATFLGPIFIITLGLFAILFIIQKTNSHLLEEKYEISFKEFVKDMIKSDLSPVAIMPGLIFGILATIVLIIEGIKGIVS